MKNHFLRKLFLMILAASLSIPAAYAGTQETETEEQNEEHGVDEIVQLVELSQVTETDGMGLEELTESFSDTAMADYTDSFTGFFVQYPAFFLFDDQQEIPEARTADGKASLLIENMPNDGKLTEETLIEAIRFQDPDAEIIRNDQNGCLRVDGSDEGDTVRTELFLIAEKSFHHLTIRYPADEKERYDPYIRYMINTMEITGTDQG